MASRNITVNAVAPGFIATDMTAVLPEEVKDKMLAGVPLKRMGTPDDIAAAVRFLASDDASYITGHVLDVNGGMYMVGRRDRPTPGDREWEMGDGRATPALPRPLKTSVRHFFFFSTSRRNHSCFAWICTIFENRSTVPGGYFVGGRAASRISFITIWR